MDPFENVLKAAKAEKKLLMAASKLDFEVTHEGGQQRLWLRFEKFPAFEVRESVKP
jgi:hypothetical protein